MTKTDCEPLLGPGRHRINLKDLDCLAVKPFPSSSSRSTLFRELEKLVGHLEKIDFSCELWIDGSFLTDKKDPNDIDLTVYFYESDVDLSNVIFRDLLYKLNGKKAYSPMLDCYICPVKMMGDPNFDPGGYLYWGEMWGKGRDDSLKGFVVLRIGETDVGLRLIT